MKKFLRSVASPTVVFILILFGVVALDFKVYGDYSSSCSAVNGKMMNWDPTLSNPDLKGTPMNDMRCTNPKDYKEISIDKPKGLLPIH